MSQISLNRKTSSSNKVFSLPYMQVIINIYKMLDKANTFARRCWVGLTLPQTRGEKVRGREEEGGGGEGSSGLGF